MNTTLNTIEQTVPNSSDSRKRTASSRQQRMITNHKKMRRNGVRRNTPSSKSQNSFAVFKYLIITTSIIFTFGGLGFGLAWRYGQDVQLSQSKINQNNTNSVSSLSR